MPAPAEPAPRLLLFLHTPKTGGSTVREWLLRNAGIRAPPQAATRLSAVVRYYEVRCFFCMQFARLWPAAVCDLALRRHCQSWTPRRRSFDSVRGDWRNASVAVELHAQSMDFYLATVAPRLPRLRALYARANGVLTTASLVREPVAFLFSNYWMWPPRPPAPAQRQPQHSQPHERRDAELLTAFPVWVSSARGLQSGFLTSPPCANSTRATGQVSRCGCTRRAAAEALSTLATLDVVGVTECMATFFDRVERALRLAPDPPLVRLQRRAARGANTTHLPSLHSRPKCGDCARDGGAPRGWTWEALDETQRRTTRDAASCDAPLYREALRRVHDGGPTGAAAGSSGQGAVEACPAAAAPGDSALTFRGAQKDRLVSGVSKGFSYIHDAERLTLVGITTPHLRKTFPGLSNSNHTHGWALLRDSIVLTILRSDPLL